MIIWEKIKHKTRYSIEYDTSDLIKRASGKMKDIVLSKPKLVRAKADILMDDKSIRTGFAKSQEAIEINDQMNIIPDVLSYIQGKTRLTRDTICRILVASDRLDDIFINPQQFMDKVSSEINTVLVEMIVDGVKYEKADGASYDQKLFDNDELFGYLDDLFVVNKKEKTVYDYVKVDSNIERNFAQECENRDDVKFYFKLPGWFFIDTPIGKYNPDWAFVLENDTKVYFVAETKGTSDINDLSLSNDERYKIKCGHKHYDKFKDVKFKAPVKTLSDIIT